MTEMETKSGNNRVQLGVGTLIIIALIVTMCSGGGEAQKIRSDTAALRQKLEVIDQKLDTLLSKGNATASTSVETTLEPADADEVPPQKTVAQAVAPQ